MATKTTVLTSKFGLVPDTKEDIMDPPVLGMFLGATNIIIEAGATLGKEHVSGTTNADVKRFYDVVRKLPDVKARLEETGIRERAMRCAAQQAYFPLQELWRRREIVPAIIQALQDTNSMNKTREKTFPSRTVLDQARALLSGPGIERGCLGTTYLSNMARHARNILHPSLKPVISSRVVQAMLDIAGKPGFHAAVEPVVARVIESLPSNILRANSKQLTRRVHQLEQGKGRPRGKHSLDATIDAILAGKPLDRWQDCRRAWRDTTMGVLKHHVTTVDAKQVVTSAIDAVLARLDGETATRAMFRKPRVPGANSVPGATTRDLVVLVGNIAHAIVLDQLGTDAWEVLAGDIDAFTTKFKQDLGKHLPLPRCRRASIPLALDDGQVYDLAMERDASTGKVTGAKVKFSLQAGDVKQYTLRGHDRIDAMLARGFTPARGTVTRKGPGCGLVLNLPFTGDQKGSELGKATGPAPAYKKDTITVGSVDLGLKDLAWLSVDECTHIAGGRLERVDPSRGDIARYRIDEPQLAGTKDSWFLPASTGGAAPKPAGSTWFHFKQKLYRLRVHARALQARIARLRARYSCRYKNTGEYSSARRQWMRCWRKIANLHAEMTRQVATRIVAASVHHGVDLLRFEDLSWSSHSSKREAGSWLASWQVHWFHAQVQDRVTLLARLAGIDVELVNARGTSKRCSKCGEHGKREGKRFTCTSETCGTRLDADLNAARNVCVATTSPRL